LIEDEESIQYALMEVINALMRNTIDMKRATLIIRALHIAVKNAARVKYNMHSRDMVTEIPEYAVPPVDLDGAETSEADLPYSAFLPPQSEHQIAEQRRRANKAQEWRDQQAAIRANLERAAQTVAGGGTRGVRTEGLETGVSVGTSVDVGTGGLNVGTGASARPASKASVPSAAATTTAVQRPAAAIPPHDFKTPNSAAPPAMLPQPSRLSKAENLDSSASDRKPPEATLSPRNFLSPGEVIWHHDIRHELSRSHIVTHFHTPEALIERLQKDLDTSCQTLIHTPNDHPRLRPYQIDANAAIEKAISGRKQQMLVAMADE
jgi:hypothetical protein